MTQPTRGTGQATGQPIGRRRNGGRACRRGLRLAAALAPLLLLAACEGNPLEDWAYQRTLASAPPQPAPVPNVPAARVTPLPAKPPGNIPAD